MSADSSPPPGLFEVVDLEFTSDCSEPQEPRPFDPARYSPQHLRLKWRQRKQLRAYYESHGRSFPYVPGVDDVLERIAMIQPPVALGLLLCEQVIIEEGTKHVTPVNCFSRRVVAGFPSAPVTFVVLANLTDGMGELSVDLVIERLDTFDPIRKISGVFQFKHPLDEIWVKLRVRNVVFPVAGAYQAKLLAGNEFVAQHRFLVSQKG